jgi:hypothetical protein
MNQILNIDCREGLAGLEDGSVALIMTDPPYLAAMYEEAYGILAEHGPRVLRPGGWLITYAPQYHLPHIMRILGERLDLYVRKGDEMGMDADDYTFGWVTFNPYEVENRLGITGDHTLAARREAAKKNKEAAARLRQEIIEEGRSLLQEKFPDRKVFADWSWDDYGQKVGPEIGESEHWRVHEYLIDGKVVGICLVRKPGHRVSPADVVQEYWGYSANSVIGRMEQTSDNLENPR